MELNSSLYQCRVYHDRRKPKKNSFGYNIFMFMLDLDELDVLNKKFRFIGLNSFNLFSFYSNDHFKKPGTNSDTLSVREKLVNYLRSEGISQPPKQIKLLTQLRILGYVFNPVSFYYCYDEKGELYCVVAEVTNTYGEMKLYLVQEQVGQYFTEVKQKYFYISPFTQLDDHLELKIGHAANKLKIYINDFDKYETKVKTVLSGKKRKLTSLSLIKNFLKFPLLTIQIISLIHWQALKLWLKGVKYIPKNENMHLQQDIYYKKKNQKDVPIDIQENRAEFTGKNAARPTHA